LNNSVIIDYTTEPYIHLKIVKAGHGDACLQSQHSGGRSRRILSSRPAGLQSKFQASLSYIVRPCLKKIYINNNKIVKIVKLSSV
jgi:hypothetical protein